MNLFKELNDLLARTPEARVVTVSADLGGGRYRVTDSGNTFVVSATFAVVVGHKYLCRGAQLASEAASPSTVTLYV